eukprot:TRINITY_DN1498_c0_g2_i1.p1 TRINITY_DN1498_c0_g2~~TRINITY_DN1498_c0_g2_i1.p1  ORF type:complete len:761 (-),score=70.04 TRINITY_DN1498_c0_g2_i1:30-2312(-)
MANPKCIEAKQSYSVFSESCSHSFRISRPSDARRMSFARISQSKSCQICCKFCLAARGRVGLALVMLLAVKHFAVSRLQGGVRSASTLETLKNLRDKFRHLRGANFVAEAKKAGNGNVISLPDFTSLQITAKGILPKVVSSMYISPQRIAILEEVENDFVNKPMNPQRGLILSGPNGSGKTTEAYLLAAHAFVNHHCVLYIPSCTDWLGAAAENWTSANYLAQYALKHFLALNADLIANWSIKNPGEVPTKLKEFKTLDKLLEAACLKENVDVAWDCEQLLDAELSATKNGWPMIKLDGKEHRLRYYRIYDEANAAYEPHTLPVSFAPSVPALHGYFATRFRVWPSETNFINIQLGSANSKGETTPFLSSGQDIRIRRIQPLPDCSEVLKIEDFTPTADLVKKYGPNSSLLVAALKEHTGFFPRYLNQLHIAGTLPIFLQQHGAFLGDRLRNFLRLADSDEKAQFERFLVSLFGNRKGPVWRTSISGLFYDHGLVYIDAAGEVRPVTDTAFSVLQTEYFARCKRLVVKPLDPAVNGSQLEKNIVWALASSALGRTWTFVNANGDKKDLTISGVRVRDFYQSNEQGNTIRPNLGPAWVLFTPRSETYRAFDFVLVGPLSEKEANETPENRAVLFGGVSTTNATVHNKNSSNPDILASAFNPQALKGDSVVTDPVNQRNQVEQFLDCACGAEKDKRYKARIEGKEFKFTAPNGKAMANVMVVHFSNLTEAKQGINTRDVENAGYSNLWLMGKEGLDKVSVVY